MVCELTTLHFKGKRQLEIMGGKKKPYVGSGHHRWRSSPQAVITAGGLYRRRSSPLAVLTVLGLGGHERTPAYTMRIPRKCIPRVYHRIPQKPRLYHAYTARIPRVYRAYTTRIPRVYHAYTTKASRIPRVYHAYTSAHQRIPAYTSVYRAYTSVYRAYTIYNIYIYTKATAMMLNLF